MRIEFENYNNDWDDIQYKFAIDWFHYNHKPEDEVVEKRNRYRQRLNMPKILDNGHYFYFRFYFGRRVIGLYVTIRDMKLTEFPKSETDRLDRMLRD